MNFEYVGSGCSWIRLNFEEVESDPALMQWVKDANSKMQGVHNHSFGLLANAYTEKTLIRVLGDTFRSSLSNVYADSGGLQIITQGLTADENTKKEIYKTQAKYSDIAMCFDEIPLDFEGEKSKRLDRTGRWFDYKALEEKARQTGRNVHEQINLFLDEKTNTKPVVIIQGNCFDTYRKWCDYVLEEIPQEKHQYIGGVALGTGAFGHGDLEEITKAFIFSNLPIYENTKHLHLLGVGSSFRLLPYIISMENGHYDKDKIKVSYDSTTHTSGLHFGRYYKDGKNVDVPKHFDQLKYEYVYNDVKTLFNIEDIPLSEFYDALTSPSLGFKEKYGSRNNLVRSDIAWCYGMIKNFMLEVDMLSNKEYMLSRLDKKRKNAYNSLYGVKTLEDFKHWEKHVGRFVESKRVYSSKPVNLGDLF